MRALVVALVLVLAGLLASPAGAQTEFGVLYDVRLEPTSRSAKVRIRIRQNDQAVRTLRFAVDRKRHRDWSGDGDVETGEDYVLWTPPPSGGSLRYNFRIDHLRSPRSYDARCAEDWAVFRGDDLVPPATATLRPGAESNARLRFRLPEGWSEVAPYPLEGKTYRIDNPRRRFDRPTGWMVVSKRMGTIRERVAGVQVTIAGPAGHGLRRLDILALLRWNLPALREALGKLPDRLLIVGAGDPMWRGGLSGPRSLFIHSDRPLITPDGTSPLLHEVVHVALPLRAAPGNDWIVEGLAELYSLESLVRSGSVSRKRFKRALAKLIQKGRSATDLTVAEASGPVTGRALTVLRELDQAISRATGSAKGLDDVVRKLAAADTNGELDAALLRATAEEVSGTSLAGFFSRRGIVVRPNGTGTGE